MLRTRQLGGDNPALLWRLADLVVHPDKVNPSVLAVVGRVLARPYPCPFHLRNCSREALGQLT
eukprot:COSAG05_NODE_845_length_7001_cov_88.935091_3_plen_63_part_00